MKYLNRVIIISFAIVFFGNNESMAQGKVIDEVIAVIGDEIATKSEVEIKMAGIIANGMAITDNTRCEVIEDVLYTKVLLNQAKVDSIDVTESQVEGELDRRIRYYISQIGSEKAMEAYYKKPLSKIKDDLRSSLKDQLLMQGMQAQISANVSVTPEEVQEYFKKIDPDSIPLINSEVEVSQIVAYAPTSKSSIKVVKDKLREYKKRISEGEKFSTIAVLYSEDTESAKAGGEIGFVGRAEVQPEYSAAAFALKAGQISPIVKTRFGYHIIQLIERRGNKINTRHILLKPKLDPKSMERAKNQLDSISNLMRKDSISFEIAAKRFSEDEETKKGGGTIINPYSGSSSFSMDDLDPSLFFVIDKMEEGEVSVPVLISDPTSKPGYRMIKLIKRTKPHKANLKDDYQKIKSAALADKEQKELIRWMSRTIENTYVKMDDSFVKGCDFKQDWIK